MTTPSRSRAVRGGLALAASLALAGAGGSAAASAADPAGNNGTIKVASHEACAVTISWYGFDEGSDVVSQVSFEMQAPTSGVDVRTDQPLAVPVGTDPAGGGTDFDGDATFRLVFTGDAHPQQGYHVKVTVRTPFSRGADTKHKVLWVTGCGDDDGGGSNPSV